MPKNPRRPDDEIDQDARDRRRAAASKRQREHRGRREPRRAFQRPGGIPDVGPERLKGCKHPRLPYLFLDLLGSTELEPRPAPCLFGRHAGRDVIGNLSIDVELQLLVDLRIDGTAAEDFKDMSIYFHQTPADVREGSPAAVYIICPHISPTMHAPPSYFH